MNTPRLRLKRHSLFRVCWFLAFLLLCFAYWWLMSNVVIRDFWDPQYVAKEECLKTQLQAMPGHPLWLMLGTSRVRAGLAPGVLADRMKAGPDAPLTFNFGIGGATLHRERVVLRRLLAGGIHPTRVGIEVVGADMSRAHFGFADQAGFVVRSRKNELEDLCTYSSNPDGIREFWRESRINPFYGEGFKVPGRTLAWRLLPLIGCRMEEHPYDPWGWLPEIPGAMTDEQVQEESKQAKERFDNAFQDFKIARATDQPLREMLELCRKEGIDVFLFHMPEAGFLQVYYTPRVEAELENYFTGIKSRYGVGMLDARLWFPDKDDYAADGYHLTPKGAEKFTHRFADELFTPVKLQTQGITGRP